VSPGETWPSLIAKRLPIEILNTGISGDTTGGMLGRFFPEIIDRQPDIILITGGTNDLWWGLSVNTILANLFAMASQTEHHGISCILGVPIPIIKSRAENQHFMPPMAGYDNCMEMLEELKETLIIRARDNGIAILDFYSLFKDEKGEIISDYFLQDGLHANERGHHVMAEKTIDFLRSRFFPSFSIP